MKKTGAAVNFDVGTLKSAPYGSFDKNTGTPVVIVGTHEGQFRTLFCYNHIYLRAVIKRKSKSGLSAAFVYSERHALIICC